MGILDPIGIIPPVRQVRMPLFDSQVTGSAQARDLTQCTVIPVPDEALQLRFVVRNVNNRAAVGKLTSPATITGFWCGEAEINTASWASAARPTGNTLGAPVPLATGPYIVPSMS